MPVEIPSEHILRSLVSLLRDFYGPALPCHCPTRAAPGTAAKIAILRRRAAAGRELHRKGDLTLWELARSMRALRVASKHAGNGSRVHVLGEVAG